MSMTPELADAGVETVLAKPVTATALDAVLRNGLPAAALATPDVAPAAAKFPDCRILLVEDNPVNRDVALELLRGVGLDADTAADGREALDRARRTRYDLVLMDVQMPVMDGLAATRELRALPGWADVPILAMTANAFAEDRDRCLAAGMDDYVAKPVMPDRLYGTLERWLRFQPERPAAPPRPPAGYDPLAGIDGLDAAAGLANVRGNVDTYHRLLRLFASMHGDDVERWRRLRETGERETARRLAHSLKGSAGVLGITGVQQHAAALETAMRADASDADQDALADRLESELARVLGRVAAALGR
jgi:two-component system sensor histidine kinase/response regulator